MDRDLRQPNITESKIFWKKKHVIIHGKIDVVFTTESIMCIH